MIHAASVLDLLRERRLTLSVAESCTGGMLSDALVSVPGASAVFVGGLVTYATALKYSLLSVSPQTVETHTVVSEQTAIEMAMGCRARCATDCAVSVTGVAGPPTDADPAPVGTVCIGVVTPGSTHAVTCRFPGDRSEVRAAAVQAALEELYLSLTSGIPEDVLSDTF